MYIRFKAMVISFTVANLASAIIICGGKNYFLHDVITVRVMRYLIDSDLKRIRSYLSLSLTR